MLWMLLACNDNGVTAFNAEPVADILSHDDGDGVDPGVATRFEGTASDPDDGPDRLTATWTLDGDEVCSGNPDAEGITTCDITVDGVEGEIKLLVTDSQNASASDTITVSTCVSTGDEVCDDGVDNNCDGRIDEGCLGTNCFEDDDAIDDPAYTQRIGQMTEDDQEEPAGYYRDDWEFEALNGEKYAVHVWSEDFDTRIELYDPDCELYLDDSDSGRDTNAFRRFTVPEDGIWTVVVTSDVTKRTGEYLIEVLSDENEVGVNCARETAAMDILEEPYSDSQDGTLQNGDQENVLGAGFYNDDIEFFALYGDHVITTQQSSAHDPVLAMFDPACQLVTYNDDDNNGGTTNSRIEHTIDRTGIYTLTPSSKYQGQTGLYVVTAEATW